MTQRLPGISNWFFVFGLFWLLQLTLPDLLSDSDELRAQRRLIALHQQPPDPSIVILGIDDEVFAQERFNRLEHAHVVEVLDRAGVRQIFFDVLFDEPRGEAVDAPLVAAIQASRKVILAAAYQFEDDATVQLIRPRLFPGLQDLVLRGEARMGIINTSKARTKTYFPLAFEDRLEGPDNPWGVGLRVSPAVAMLAAKYHLQPGDVEIVGPGHWQGALLRIPPSAIETQASMEAPDRQGQPQVISYRAPIRYSLPSTGPGGKPEDGRIPVIPYLKVADEDPETLAFLKNKFVFIGETTRGDTDIVDTPRGKMKGVEVHAHIFDTLLQNKVPLLPESGTSTARFCFLVVSLFCLLFAYLFLRQPGLKRCFLLLLGFLAFWEGLVLLLDRFNLFLPQTLGERSLVVVAILCLSWRFLTSARVLRTFIPAEIVDQLVLRGEDITQGEVDATVMVTDIRGYTTLSESRTPSQVLTLLNDYHTETVALYEKFGGYVLNYQGDAQIILFGHPKKVVDPALKAVQAAQAASGAVERLRQKWQLPEGQTFNVGAGLCSGKVIIADLGGDHREYTVIGELVRKGHKLQSQSDALRANIILDEETFARCNVKPEVERRDEVSIEGLPQPVTVYITDLYDPPEEPESLNQA